MALINCPECKKEVSNTAGACPNCGYPINFEAKKQKKRKNGITFFLLVLLSILIIIYVRITNEPYNSRSNYSDTPITESPIEKSLNVSVEDLKIIKESQTAWAVKGLIRNNTTIPIKGAVNIKFLNSNGDIVYSTKAYVNDGGYFAPGQAAIFDYFDSPSQFKDVVNFKIEFYEL